MEKIGSINKRIIDDAALMNEGRPLLYTEGGEVQGRVLFVTGVSDALQAFKEAQATKNPETMIQAEQFFVKEELLHVNKQNDKFLWGSLNNAIISFSDALDALSVVENSEAYKNVEKTYQTTGKDRFKGLPNDAFHKACASHKARIANMFKTPGLSDLEKELLRQRSANIDTARNQYIEKQKAALELAE